MYATMVAAGCDRTAQGAAMRTTAGASGDTMRTDLVRRGLESAWRRACDGRARAAQCGDYAAAEHWHRRALALGASLAAGDRARPGRAVPRAPSG